MNVRLLAALILVCAAPTAFAQSALTHLSDSFEKLAERVSPAVVQIIATGYSPRSETQDETLLIAATFITLLLVPVIYAIFVLV